MWLSLLFALKYTKASPIWIPFWKIRTYDCNTIVGFHLELNGHVCGIEERIIGE